MRIWSLLTLLLASLLPVAAEPAAVPNASFEKGSVSPDSWTLSGGKGGWEQTGHTGKRCLMLIGDGKESQYWKCDNWQPEPQKAYRLSFWAKAVDGGGGCLISGLNTANLDFSFSNQWRRYSRVFVTPQSLKGAFLRLGQWSSTGKLLLDDVRVSPVMPLNGETGVTELGEGEQIAAGRYSFQAPFDSEGSNYARVLAEHTASYNSNRWVMTDGSSIVYRHQVAQHRQLDGAVGVNIGYYVSGQLIVEAGKDGRTWQRVGVVTGKEGPRFTLPASLFPADVIWIRLRAEGTQKERGDSQPGEFQIHGYRYEAGLEGHPADEQGRTAYLDVERSNGPAQVTVESLGTPGAESLATRLRIANPGKEPLRAQAALTLSREGKRAAFYQRQVLVPAGGAITVSIPYALAKTGTWQAALRVQANGKETFAASTEFTVPALYAADYGYLAAGDQTAVVWWSESPYKISRTRPAPSQKRAVVALSAARREYEPVQVVLRPKRALSGVSAALDDFVGPNGTRIARTHANINLVGYVPVSHPTDRVGSVAAWPDPLPPCTKPFDVAAGMNQPLWITVYVPADARAGDYTSTLRLRAGAWHQNIPVRLHVWNFSLPEKTHLHTAFGFSTGMVRQYHNLETSDEVARVVDLYYRDMAAHRMAPYNAMEMAPIKVSFSGVTWEGGLRVTEQPGMGKACLQVSDDSQTSVSDAKSSSPVAINPEAAYTLSWMARTAQDGQQYQLTLQCYDAGGSWIPGHNIDLTVPGSTAWKQETRSLKGLITPQARSVTLTLRPARWSEDGKTTGTAWFDSLSLRQDPDGPELLPDGGFEGENGAPQVKVDFTAFDKAAAYAFDTLGFNSFSLGIQGMGGGTFFERTPGRIGSFAQGTPEYEALFGSYVRQLQDHLEAKGWLDKAYIYWFDEPEPRDYEFVKDGMSRIKRYAPKLARMLTEQPEKELLGDVDIWCPITNAYTPEKAQARQAAGEHIWWYVCTGPKEPYCTLFIDHPGIEMRMWLWQTVKYGVEGILVWQSNYWTSGSAYPTTPQNPWDDPMSYVSGYGFQAGQVGFWGNGDGRFLYPPNRDPAAKGEKYLSGPVDSIRWEMLREGIEDYEYFWLLRDLIRQNKGTKNERAAASKLLEVPASICNDMTHFTTDPLLLYTHRRKLAQAIETLAKPGK